MASTVNWCQQSPSFYVNRPSFIELFPVGLYTRQRSIVKRGWVFLIFIYSNTHYLVPTHKTSTWEEYILPLKMVRYMYSYYVQTHCCVRLLKRLIKGFFIHFWCVHIGWETPLQQFSMKISRHMYQPVYGFINSISATTILI